MVVGYCWIIQLYLSIIKIRREAMKKSVYNVSLVNAEGCNFDNGEFTNLREAKTWARGRGATLILGEWKPYTVFIRKDGELVEEYKTR